MEFVFSKVKAEEALQIATWEYPVPYQHFSLRGSPLATAKLMTGRYFAAWSVQGELIGFVCFGSSAQLTGQKEHALYGDSGFLDLGLGLKPDFCDRGLGSQLLGAAMAFAREHGWTGGFRLTVASNNLRAVKVYLRLGFKERGKISWDPHQHLAFLVLTLDSSVQE